MGTTRISVLLGPVLCSGCLMVSTPEEGSEEAGKPPPVPLGRVRCLISLFAFRTTPASQGPPHDCLAQKALGASLGRRASRCHCHQTALS